MHAIPTLPEASNGWGFNGDLEAPTFTPSILINQGKGNPTAPVCHLYVAGGWLVYLADCTHALAGQTVQLPDVSQREPEED